MRYQLQFQVQWIEAQSVRIKGVVLLISSEHSSVVPVVEAGHNGLGPHQASSCGVVIDAEGHIVDSSDGGTAGFEDASLLSDL